MKAQYAPPGPEILMPHPMPFNEIALQSYVADDGCLHIVAERASIQAAVAGLDLERARLLTRLSLFWVRRVR